LFIKCSSSTIRSVTAATQGGALIGRSSELARLAGLIRAAAARRGSAVLIEGEPGIGKSSLVRAAIAEAADAHCPVFWGSGDELGQALPLLPLLEAMRVRELPDSPRRNTIVRLLRGELAAGPGADVSAALAEQLLALIAEQCAAQPAILVVDDLQWADPATVMLWARLARSVQQMPLLLAGMMRPVPQREDLLALRRAAGDAARLRLTRLADEAVAELVTALAGGAPGDDLLQLAGGAAGNPLYVTELVAALARGGRLTVTGTGTLALASGSAPASLSAAIADRVDFLSTPTREVLQAAAVLGVDFAVPDLTIVLDRPIADLMPAIDEARAAGVITDTADGLSFRHPLIQAALYDAIPASVRATWHSATGRALAHALAPPERVARQLLGAFGGPGPADPIDDWLLSWLADTADVLVARAPQVAADLLRYAVAGCPAGSARHGLLASRLADALYRVGDAIEAEQVASLALDHVTEPDVLVDLHWTLAQCRLQAGKSAESLDALHRALAAPGITARHRARLWVLAARTHGNLGEVEKAGDAARAALTAAEDAGDNWAMGWALCVLITVTAMQGQTTGTLPLFDRALAVTQAEPALTDLRLLLQINKAVSLGDLDRYEEAFAAAREARHLATLAGTVVRLTQAHSALGQLLFDTGQWAVALAEVQALEGALKEPGAACIDLGIAAVICFHRGDITEARRHLTAAAPYAERIGNRVVAPLALARSLDREAAGNTRGALAALTANFTGNTEELDEVEELVADAVRLACEIGDLDTAETLSGHAEALAAGSDIPHRQANTLFCRGLLDHDPARLLQAAQRYSDGTRPLLAAETLEAAAGELVAAGDRDQGRAAFIQAMEIYTSLGAAADAARLQAVFRAHGIRRGPRAKHRTARRGWDSLTQTEVRVAGLVGEGMSNPEIAAKLLLSRRTVATHVSHILKKLDVHSRTDIAREAALRSR
jgi:DNA-binding CsgD family transcriptional regulator/tetratricopeptide (TPR) repeat protein